MVSSVAVGDHVGGAGGAGSLLAEGGDGAPGAADDITLTGLEGEGAVELGDRLVEQVGRRREGGGGSGGETWGVH
jgi:hypothetical protein